MSEENQTPVPRPPRGSWHEIAKKMRDEGLTYHEIGRRLGVSGPAVYFCINPHKRWFKKNKGAEAPSPSQAAT
jgi:hypothetical protein